MPKYKISVEQVYFVEHIVEADDRDHALEIASEVENYMDANSENYFESNYDAVLVDYNSEVDYVPESTDLS